MKLFFQIFLTMLFIALKWARPRYITVPWNYAQLMESSPRSYTFQPLLPRLRRDVPVKTAKNGNYLAQASSPFEQRSNNFNPHGYVDYGAHTGNSGSFGWYADFPVH